MLAAGVGMVYGSHQFTAYVEKEAPLSYVRGNVKCSVASTGQELRTDLR